MFGFLFYIRKIIFRIMQKEFSLISSYFNKLEINNLEVSKASVGWHIDHSLKVINFVCDNISGSNPNEYKPRFNKWRIIAFTLGFFPRGKAKSPKRVSPPEVVLKESILKQFNKAKANIESIKELEDDNFFTHPIFKQLNKSRTQKFLKLHTKHHLKIIKDILK